MKNKYLVSILILFTIICISSWIYYQYTTGPEFSLLKIKQAYEEHDVEKFEKYVDIKTMTDGILNELLTKIENESINSSDAEKLGKNLAVGIVNLFKSQVEELWREHILRLVESGETDGKEGNKSFEKYWVKTDSVEYRKVTDIKTEGKICWLKLELFHPRFDTSLFLDIKMRDKGIYWQLFELPNIGRYINRLDSLEKARVDKLNNEVKQLISQAFQATKIDLRIVSEGYYYITKDLHYKIEFENTGVKPIKDIAMTFHLLDSKGQYIEKVFLIKENIFLLPNQKYVLKGSKYLGYDNNKINIQNANIELDHGSITFDDQSELNWHYEWEKLEEDG